MACRRRGFRPGSGLLTRQRAEHPATRKAAAGSRPRERTPARWELERQKWLPVRWDTWMRLEPSHCGKSDCSGTTLFPNLPRQSWS